MVLLLLSMEEQTIFFYFEFPENAEFDAIAASGPPA
jgi:hypothetical protein